MRPYYDEDGITIYHGDCREVLPSLGPVDAVVTDPPYGMAGASHQGGSSTFAWSEVAAWDGETAADVVAVLPALAPHVVIWGGNYYALPPSRCWLLWDKKQDGRWDGAHAEMAWTNLDCPVRIFRMSRVEAHTGMNKQHPTQKPLSLMSWCMQMIREPVSVVLDPFMGSGTTLRAAKERGLRAVGIEQDERYCEIAAKRLAQGVLDFGGAA